MPLTYSYWLFKEYFSIGWNPDCRKQYKISFKCTYRVRALGAFIRNTYLACQQRPESKNLGDDMSATSCTTGTSSLFPITPIASSTADLLAVGRDVTVVLSTKSWWKCFDIQKDVSYAGDSRGISFKTISPLLFLLFGFWCYKNIFVQVLGQRLFHVRDLVLPYTKIHFVLNCFIVPPYL